MHFDGGGKPIKHCRINEALDFSLKSL